MSEETPTRRAGLRLDDEMQVGNMPEHQKDEREAAFADQAVDRGSAKPVEVDMPTPAEGDAETLRGTVPDVMDPAIEGDARDRRAESVLQEGVSYGEKDGGVREAPYEAANGFSAERLAERDAEKGNAPAPDRQSTPAEAAPAADGNPAHKAEESGSDDTSEGKAEKAPKQAPAKAKSTDAKVEPTA